MEDAVVGGRTGVGSGALVEASSACGKVTLVPSAHVTVSGAQSSSSSSMSAQLDWPWIFSECSRVAI